MDAVNFGADGVKFLVTTRLVQLANDLPYRVRVDLLSDPEGADLILRRAELKDDQRADCEAVSRQLNGLTLAVSIAAAKIKNDGLTPSAYLERLKRAENPFSELTLADLDDPFADPNNNEENLEASLALTYGELNPEMQRRFQRLGVFAPEGTFDVAAVAAVWDEPLETAQQKLNVLVTLELAARGEDGRYSQHSLLRAYARAALKQAGELEAASTRHFEHYFALHGDYDTNNDETHHPQITSDFENIRAALAWASDHAPIQAADWAWALYFYLQLHQPYSLWRAVLEQGLAAATHAEYRLGQANTLQALGDLEMLEANYGGARERYRAALGLFEAIPSRLGQANTLQALGDLEMREANYGGARERYRAALGLFEAIPDRLGQANTLQALGDLESSEGNYPLARQRYAESLALARQIPDMPCQLNCLIGLAHLEKALGNHEAACQRYAELFTLTDSLPAFANHPVVQGWRQEYRDDCGGAASGQG